VSEALGGAPGNLTYVPLDLEESIPKTLVRHGYDIALRTFILMEGVSMYLPEDALKTTLRFIASHAPGSSLVFDFATRAMVEGIQRIDLAKIPEMARASTERFLEMIRDEPWLFGIPLDDREVVSGRSGSGAGRAGDHRRRRLCGALSHTTGWNGCRGVRIGASGGHAKGRHRQDGGTG
jgi:methyltransferase (TIGR00027 family)